MFFVIRPVVMTDDFHSIRFKVIIRAQRSPFFKLFTTISAPSSPTLSQSHSFVATTPTRIRLFSWNQPQIPVPLQQLFEYCFCSFLHKSIFGYWYFGLETKKARSGEPSFMTYNSLHPTKLHSHQYFQYPPG